MADNETGSGAAAEATPPRGFIADGVRLGYQVIDAYIKQGQKIAERFAAMPYGPERANGDPGELEVRAVQLLTELMANWSDFVGVYSEALRPAAGAARRQGPPQEHTSATPGATSDGPAIQLAYEVTSRRPALVNAEFFPGRETLNLASHGLRCLGSCGAEIRVVFEQEPERRRTIVSIDVPDEQPAGLYTGALLDSRDGSAVGGLSVRIR